MNLLIYSYVIDLSRSPKIVSRPLNPECDSYCTQWWQAYHGEVCGPYQGSRPGLSCHRTSLGPLLPGGCEYVQTCILHVG